jgi:ADP-heptose:LPS heptosyltransferase
MMAEKFHVSLRKKLALSTQKILKKFFVKEAENTKIDIGSIHKILVIRVNYRIGNILFTTPLLNALAKQFPNAQIDMMIGAPFITPLIEGMPHINKVYSFDRKLLKQPLKVLKLRKEVNQNDYDIMILSSGLSSSDAVMSWLIEAKYKIGFYDKNSFKKLTHTVVALPEVKHEALVPLSIMQRLGVSDVSQFENYLDLCLTQSEKERENMPTASKTIGIFRDARGEKKIDDQWWKEFIETMHTLDDSFKFIDILDPNNQIPLHKNMEIISEKNLRTLAAKISNLNAFICADTGPMHLASAAGTATVALFKTTTPTLYGTLGKKDLSLVISGKTTQALAEEIIKHLKNIEGQV